MKKLKLVLVSFLAVTLIPWASLSARTSNIGQSTALERGYRTGYSDGYNAGFKDTSEGASRDYQSKEDYQTAERSYNQVWGPVEDYRDGYQQGFEAGYTAGYERQPFNSSIPTGLSRRSLPDSNTSNSPAPATTTAPDNVPSSNTAPDNVPSSNTTMSPSIFIPRSSMMLVELQSGLSTDSTQRGDRFQARVLEPREWEGAVVEGRVTSVKRPGKVKGVAELQLTFDTIRFSDNRIANFSADLVEVVQMGSSDGVGSVEPEGGVRGKDSTKDDVSKVGAATGIGAIIGAIVGGGKGAAIGAAIGAGVGTGGVLQQRGKDIRLERGQQLRIRTASETRVESRNQT
jgi:hypothetical protein